MYQRDRDTRERDFPSVFNRRYRNSGTGVPVFNSNPEPCRWFITSRRSRGQIGGLIYEKQKPFDNEVEPTIVVFCPPSSLSLSRSLSLSLSLFLFPSILFSLLPLLPPTLLFSSFCPREIRKDNGDPWPTKTDIPVVGTIVRGLTIDPEKEISSSHEVHPFYFLLSLVFRYRGHRLLFPFPTPLLFLVFLFTAANNSFCDVISLRLCSFADTPFLYSISRNSYGSSFLPSLYARHVSLPLRFRAILF